MASSVPTKPPTAADVATLAGVSKATATRALGGYGRINEETKRRVLAAANQLGYHPNAAAQTMNTGRSGSLGIVARGITNPVWPVAFQGMVDAARLQGLAVLFAGSGFEVSEERKAIRLLLGKQVDGLIVSAADRRDVEHLQRITAVGTPLVLWERRVPGLDAPVIEADMRQASSELTRRLLDLGHRRIGFVSSLAMPQAAYSIGAELPASIIQDKVEGLFTPFSEAGIAPPVDLVRFPERDRDAIAAAYHSLLDGPNPPTALIASDSQIAETMLDVVRSRGLRIPGEVSLAMYDDLSWARLVDPPLTVIAQPDYDMGKCAAELAMNPAGASTLPSFSARLILRGSVGRAQD
ncbi:LacI family DNA-binding transcriptional regulator [Microbacterium jejuense]|uniref:LacI family DNA-binding transcriptional regulator n=1 Tax=Microbacterium jejuense TaxID=1263637 RepID=A0ABS7HL81_9MICO|nr:LacI family DNA-binding transcriptional regulator [Microbacterium jejuense]MBW9093041.1 LacI family DNA-binding transcriptional regulator [Microbacterium jejuense]